MTPRQLGSIAGALTLAAIAAPLFAQTANPFGALRSIMKGVGTQQAEPAAAPMSADEAMAALRGKWQAAVEDCYQPSDSFVFADKNSWSGYEWSCEVPAAAYNSRGFAGDLNCAAEGEEYRAKMRVELAQDGKSLTVFRPEDGTSEKLLKCPKETEEISF